MQSFELQYSDFDESHSNGITNNAVVDAAFRKINKGSTAFLIWRIENMSIVAVPKDQYGTFYDTDSYVILAASLHGQPIGVDSVPRELRGALPEYHVHFWLGSSTTPDKSGVAAYKTVELDNYLNGVTTQHRETQGNESSTFKSYFKSGMRILTSKYSKDVLSLPKLYKVKGKYTPILTQMDNICWAKFNSADIFFLHTANILFVWIGRASDAAEKLNASKLSSEIKEQCSLSNIIFMDDGYEKTLGDEEKKEWNKWLPLDQRNVMPENDSDYTNRQRTNNIRLYKCSENGGKYRVAEVKNGPLHQSDLEADDVFIIDQEINGIWIWVGKRSSDKERNEALRNARGFVKKKKYPNNTKVTRVVDGCEPVEFKTLFSFWKDEIKDTVRGTKPTVLVSKFDAATMEERPSFAAETQLIDDGSGTITLWRIKHHNIIEIPKERHGYFYNGDCYIVLYSYQTTTDEKHLLYYWLGSHATEEEIAYVSLKVAEIDGELGGLGFQAKIIQGREPAHFLQIFKGKLIIFKGKGTDFDESGRNLKHPLQYFLQIFGSTLASSKAIQIQTRTSHLNSNYCYILKRGKHVHIWCGHYSTGDQREMAKLFAGKDFELVLEGKEKSEFFDLLGGKAPYLTKLIQNDGDIRPARLFHCSSNGGIKVEEILFFSQTDLLPENIMLLDFFNVIYLWVGNLSPKEYQKQGFITASEYLQTDPCGRELNIPIIQINQGHEPPSFIGFFPSWDRKFWKGYKSFGKRRQDIELKNAKTNGKEVNGFQKSGHSDFDQYDKYPVNILKEPNDKLPARVDPLNKELHLTHDDFVAVLKMTYLDFEKLPRWKQQELKKRVGLF